LPKEGNFFELFNEHGNTSRWAPRSFMAMVQNYATARCARSMRPRSTRPTCADKITAEVNRLLHRTFITPIDREQIHGLINAMDDILDLLQDSSAR
jgi:uncharacterized protein Yka (UPF0111/DUF47 family)